MTYRLIISETAHQQIEHAIEYVALELKNPSAAEAIISDIEKTYERIRQMPNAMPLCEDSVLKSYGYHKALLEKHSYLILFRIEGELIKISGFFHTLENYSEKRYL